MRTPGAAFGLLLLVGCLDVPPQSLATGEADADVGAAGGFRKLLSIPVGAVARPLEGFPVLVRLDGDADLSAHASEGGFDVVFRDQDEMLLPFELEVWDRAGGQLRAWVALPEVGGGSPTNFFLHYGDGIEQDRSNPAQTWASDFSMVWHLDEEPDEELDSTAGAHHATSSQGSSARAPGYLGDGLLFDGSGDYVDFGSDLPAGVDVGASLTVTAWVRYDSLGQWKHFISKARVDSNSFGWGLGIDSTYDFMIRAMNGNESARGYSDAAQPVVGTWHHWALVFDGAQATSQQRLRGFRDGEEYPLTYEATIPAAFNAGGGPLYIGCAPWNTTGYCIAGAVDEVHVAPVARAPEWIAAEVASQVTGSAFVTVGDEEAL